MIELTGSTAGSTVALTLNEDTTLSGTSGINFFYLFEFIGQDTNVSYTFLATDTSTNQCRYNKFQIYVVDTVDENRTIGKIDLSGGRYKYNIYQQYSSSNLDASLANGIVEIGFCDINIPIIQTVYTDTDTGDDSENVVYQG